MVQLPAGGIFIVRTDVDAYNCISEDMVGARAAVTLDNALYVWFR